MRRKNSAVDPSTFKTVFDQSPISTQIFTPNGTTVLVNKAWQKLWGVTPAQMAGYNILKDPQLLHTPTMAYIREGFTGKIVRVPPHQYEPKQTVPTATAPARWVQNYMYPITDVKGKIIHIVMQHEDITEQKNAEQKLRQSEARFRAILEHSTDAITLISAEGKRLYSTPSRKNVLGYDRNDDIGESVFGNIHPEDLPEAKRRLAVITKSPNATDTMQIRMKHLNGNWIWIEVIGTNLLHEPDIGAVVVNFRDITTRKAAEEQLRESEAKFRKLVESNIIGVFVSDFDGTFLEANDAFLSMIGYSQHDLKHHKIHRDAITPPPLHHISQSAVAALKEVGSSSTYEKEYIHKDGHLVSVLIAVTRVSEHTCIGFVVNITDRKALEKRKDDFIGMASHELRTPVTSMKLFVQALQIQLRKEGATQYADQLAKIDAQIDKFTRLIRELLDVSKINANKLIIRKERFLLNDLIAEQVQAITAVASQPISVTMPLKIQLFADRDRIGQVLLNLLTNATKYSAPNSAIAVTVKKSKSSVQIAVTDHGRGIPKEEQSKIFDRFYQASDVATQTFPGLGMGLYISAEIVKVHHGNITVDSTVGQGTTFTVMLPVP